MKPHPLLLPLVGSSYGTPSMARTTVRAYQRVLEQAPSLGFRTARPLRQPLKAHFPPAVTPPGKQGHPLPQATPHATPPTKRDYSHPRRVRGFSFESRHLSYFYATTARDDSRGSVVLGFRTQSLPHRQPLKAPPTP